MPRKPEPPGDSSSIADREELLHLLSGAARKGHVGAMKILLEELRHDHDEDTAKAPSVIDELGDKRKKAATGR